MRNACPTCQTVYAVTPADVGRRITCTRCNANLLIDEDGFRLAEGSGGSKSVPPPPPRSDQEPAERKRSSRRARLGDDEPKKEPAKDEPKPRRRARDEDDDDDPPKATVNAGELFQKYVDVPTVVFAVGVVVVLWFLFMPIINAAGTRWYTARVEDEQLAHDEEMKRLKEKGPADGVTKEDERWRKRKEVLDASVTRAGITARQSEYWDRFGLLGGFIVTALGSIGLLMSHQPLVRKVVGGVVVAAMLLMVFYQFTAR